MQRKIVLIAHTVTHFMVDLACFFFFARVFVPQSVGAAEGTAGCLLFSLLSFGLRPLLGVLLDEYPHLHPQAVGCLAVGIGLLLPGSAAWFSLILLGAGSAFFHVCAVGESVIFARGFFFRNGIVLSSGGVGAVCGLLLGAPSLGFPRWVVLVALLHCAVGCFLFAESGRYPRRIRAFRNYLSPKISPLLALLMTLFIFFSLSLTAATFLPQFATGGLRLIPALCCALGRVFGGIFADRFGPRRTLLLSLGVAFPFLVLFYQTPWCYCLGITFLFAATAVLYGGATAALPTCPHFAAGLCGLAFVSGALPGFFPARNLPDRLTVTFCLALSAVFVCLVYTDFSHLFSFRPREKNVVPPSSEKGIMP